MTLANPNFVATVLVVNEDDSLRIDINGATYPARALATLHPVEGQRVLAVWTAEHEWLVISEVAERSAEVDENWWDEEYRRWEEGD